MEVKSKEQKTFTYTLTLNSSELDDLLAQYHCNKSEYAVGGNKIMSLFSKLNNARANDLLK